MAALALLLASLAFAQTGVVVNAVGDIRLDGRIDGIVDRQGLQAPFGDVAEWLDSGDLLFGNLECPVTQLGEKTTKDWNFRAHPRSLRILAAAGFDALNLANNHAFDYGREGLVDTITNLREAGFEVVGAGKDLAEAEGARVFDVNGRRVGIMGFTSTRPEEAWATNSRAGVAFSDQERLAGVVAAARKDVDALVVSFHGGVELAELPNDVQKAFARAAIDAGADAVVGHHPHKLQPVELYKGKPILYSVGNFLFVSPSTGTTLTVIAQLHLRERGDVRVEFLPVDINRGRLRPAAPSDAQRIFDTLDRFGALTQNPARLRVRGITPTDWPPPEVPKAPDEKLR